MTRASTDRPWCPRPVARTSASPPTNAAGSPRRVSHRREHRASPRRFTRPVFKLCISANSCQNFRDDFPDTKGVWASPLPRWLPVLWLQKCYLPIFRPGHIRIPGVTLRHFERRALMLFHVTNPGPRDNGRPVSQAEQRKRRCKNGRHFNRSQPCWRRNRLH